MREFLIIEFSYIALNIIKLACVIQVYKSTLFFYEKWFKYYKYFAYRHIQKFSHTLWPMGRNSLKRILENLYCTNYNDTDLYTDVFH